MSPFPARASLAVLAAFLPAVSSAQGLNIDHVKVGCIVAGKFPRFNACFAPSANLARARVYFRAEGAANWYYVEMKSDAPCHAGILPKPKKNLVDKTIAYYVEGVDKAFTESRTVEAAAKVVSSESECKNLPMAPMVPKASVTVFPSMPAGFASAGLSTGVIVGSVVGAGVLGGGIAAAAGGGDSTTTTTLGPSAGVTTTTTTTTSTTTTTTTLAKVQFNPVFAIHPNPPVGKDPLSVEFDMAGSTGNNLRFRIDYDGDGVDDVYGARRLTKVYTLAGIKIVPATTLAPATKSYNTRMCVADTPGQFVCQENIVTVIESTFKVDSSQASPAARRLAWVSELEVPGATGQVVVNGEAISFPKAGRSGAVAAGARGENRVEAQLVQGTGRAGTWRFDLSPTATLVPGSLKVVAGDVALVSGDVIVFRLGGKPGERVVFTFEAAR
jgi:hypothetical protein